MQLLVLGMHRSGTSGVTRLLNMAGAWFGPEGMATDANEENPKGFWERRDVRALCDELLHGGGFEWWRVSEFAVEAIPEDVRERQLAEFRRIVLQLDAHRPWVLKEPRLCLLLPLLRPILEVPICIHVTREPLEVAESVSTRSGFPVQVGLALWELYTIRSFDVSAGLPRVLVRYDDLMAEPVATTLRLLGELRDLGVQGMREPSEREITAFITPELHRQRRSAELRGLRLNEQQAQLAAAVDDGSVLERDVPAALSAGALETLRVFEDDQAQRLHVAELEERIATVERSAREQREAADQEHEAQLAAHRAAERAAAAELDRQVQAEADRRREVARVAEEALQATERQLRLIGRSRSWQVVGQLSALRRTLTPGMSRRQRGPLAKALGHVQRGKREVEAKGSDDERSPPGASTPVSAERPLITRSRPAAAATGRSKVAVLVWDVGHNPLGRANVLAGVLERRFDVEMWGAQFERYGSRIWAPLRDAAIPINSFDGRPFPAHLAVMEQVAEQIDADAIYVSKPRLPSYLLGVLAKELRNRPLVLDVDDDELAFFAEESGLDPRELLKPRRDLDLSLPFERAWTQACESVIGAADQVTVSNLALQERYGGVIIPHARDERIFDPALYDRDETRRSLGVTESQRLLIFGGTPRAHKGVVEVLQALERIGDERYRVVVFGTRELDDLRPLIGNLERWVLPLPYQRFDDLPRLVGAADLACVLQDQEHPVSRHQMPAKITDALAMAVPCLVSPVPPVRPLIDEGVLLALEPGAPLHERIEQVFAEYDDALDRAEQGRKLFLESYSYEAVSEVVAPMFERLMSDPPKLSPALAELADVPRRLFDSVTSSSVAGRAGPAVGQLPVRVPGHPRRPIAPGEQFDVVMFWKQNDSGIYGRRQDMFLKYLQRSGRVHSIVHFDNPITPEVLVKKYRGGTGTNADQSRLVVQQTVNRLARRRDSDRVHHHTFLHAGRASGRVLPKRDRYIDYVASVLERRGIGSRPTVFWVYPTNGDLPLLLDSLNPDLVVADVVDDNRSWYTTGTPEHDRVDRNYEEVLARSDVVVANCEPVAESMRRFAPEVHVVPNGCELPDGLGLGPRPKELRRLVGPIIGYVGNLSSRLDLDLLETMVRARPAWQFVFVGSAHLDKSILRLEIAPNVHFVGVKPYEEALRFIRHFDVALIPHVDNEMTRSMNPLKAFVYCAAGVPVVSTPIANLGELASVITIADGPERFIEAIEGELQAGHRVPDLDLLRRQSWDRRIEQTLDLIDRAAAPDVG